LKTIITGGSNYVLNLGDYRLLQALKGKITEVITGRRSEWSNKLMMHVGADIFAQAWAGRNGIPVTICEDVAEMVERADAAVFFPGTDGIRELAEDAGLIIFTPV